MVLYDRELVQNQGVGGVIKRELGEEEVGRGVLEGVWFGARTSTVGFGGAGWLFGEGWAVAELELDAKSVRRWEYGAWGEREGTVPGSPRNGLWRDAWTRM